MKNSIQICFCLLAFEQVLVAAKYTPLEIHNHPCTAEKLKLTNRYICTSNGTVICQKGWRDSQDPHKLDPLEPCQEPICEYHGKSCINGECRAPNYCACEVGWEGIHCDICVPLPGCQNGHCEDALECICHPGWQGGFCDKPICDNCQNGECIAPNECRCHEGWKGENCDICHPLPGCQNGQCIDQPNTCVCHPGWEGHLCDKPVCNPGCVHGVCILGPIVVQPNSLLIGSNFIRQRSGRLLNLTMSSLDPNIDSSTTIAITSNTTGTGVTIIGPDGTTIGPDGTTIGPDGTTIGPGGNTIGPDGTTIGPGGTTIGPDGTTIGPDGTTVGPDGTTIGTTFVSTIGPDGTTIVTTFGSTTIPPQLHDNFCLCTKGWSGDACDQCVPYWDCPNQEPSACVHPNECLCQTDLDDPLGLCNHPSLSNIVEEEIV